MKNTTIGKKLLLSERFYYSPIFETVQYHRNKKDYIRIIDDKFKIELFTYRDDITDIKYCVIYSDNHLIASALRSIINRFHNSIRTYLVINNKIHKPYNHSRSDSYTVKLLNSLKPAK